MLRTIMCAMATVVIAVAPSAASAKGCVKGAVVGGVAGHVAGHHGAVGAAAGCAIGHHEAKKAERQAAEQDRTRPAPSSTTPAAPADKASNETLSSSPRSRP